MLFKDFSLYLEKLENTPKRLEITSILHQLIQELNLEETDLAIYLSLGRLKAAFQDLKFNIADKSMLKMLEAAYNTSQKAQISQLYAEKGDLGDVAYEINPLEKESNLTISQVYQKMLEIAGTVGTGSQENKIKRASEMLRNLDKLSAKYAVRIMLGTTRLGFTELTVIDALALLCGNKNESPKIEQKYNMYPDIGLVAKKVKEKGLEGIRELTLKPGVPILSQRAQRVSGMEEAFERIPVFWAEFKFDGTRVQLHVDKDNTTKDTKDTQIGLLDELYNTKYLIKTYTRNLEETTHQYPDLIQAAEVQIKAQSAILDGEAIGYSKETGEYLPFQETIQRKRKHNVAESAGNIPLRYFIFDLLYLNGKSLLEKPLTERKHLLKQIIIPGNTFVIADNIASNSLEDLANYYELAKEKNLEGLIVKNPEDPYQAGARSYSWIKLKKADEKLLDDSVDCVILGYYFGKGVRSKFGIGGFLVGVYDPNTDSYKTVTKIGTGLKEDDWIKLKEMADPLKIKEMPKNVTLDKQLTPDVIIKPSLVVEIGADEISISPLHSSGYALRFPRLIKFRDDKAPTETTTLTEIEAMYQNQKVKITKK